MAVRYGSKPFKEAADYFRQKNPLPTTGSQDVYGAQHDHAFMVAGANKIAIVEEFASALQGVMDGGGTLADFRKNFDDLVDKSGWDYHGTRGWRSRLTYENNLRQAYNAGREKQAADPAFKKRFPYAEYRHSGAENFRPEHKSWDRLVLRTDDPWWAIHSPSNGYFCKCKKFYLSQRQADNVGKPVPDPTPEDTFRTFKNKRTGEEKQIPMGIDPGFEYRPGQSWIRQATESLHETNTQPVPLVSTIKPSLPEPTLVPESLLMADNLADEVYVKAFIEEFDASGELTFFDVMGEPVAINDYLFRSADGAYKISKDKIRHRYMRLLARALIEPDEIWVLLEPDSITSGKYRVKRRYIKRWVIEESGQAVHGISVYERGSGTWTGNTTFTPVTRRGKKNLPARDGYTEKQRQGILLYQREE